MAQLLPRPQYRRFNGRLSPIGTGTMSGPQRPPRPFRPNPGGPAPGRRPAGRRGCGPSGSRPLGRAWQDAPREETWPWVLAGYYHQAIVSHLPAAARGRGLRSNQISGFLNQFLSLGTRCDEAQLPGCSPTSSKRASGWGSSRRSWPGWSRPSIQGFSGPPREQVIGSFTAAQPEADLPALLQMKDFPSLSCSPEPWAISTRLLCSPSHPHQLRGPHGPEPQGRVP